MQARAPGGGGAKDTPISLPTSLLIEQHHRTIAAVC